MERALAHRLVDPISNTPLETAALTTVWPIRSKASAYREKAIRGCIARVCQPGCKVTGCWPVGIWSSVAGLPCGLHTHGEHLGKAPDQGGQAPG